MAVVAPGTAKGLPGMTARTGMNLPNVVPAGVALLLIAVGSEVYSLEGGP
jgi:hypothetical protein